MNFLQRFKLLILLCLLASTNVQAENPVVCLETSLGRVCMELFEQIAPASANNFLNYVENGEYNNTLIHRSVPGFVIQGGGFTLDVQENNNQLLLEAIEKRPPVKNEFSVSNFRGTVAMAKIAGDPDSATSEWFINLNDNSDTLNDQNGGFTVFAQVISGLEVVDAIAALPLIDFGGALNTTPTIDLVGDTPGLENFVFVKSAELIIAPATGIFENNRLSVPVDAGAFGKLQVAMDLLTLEPEITFRLDLSSLTLLAETAMELAIYNEQDLTLNIPSVDVLGTLRVTNIVMKLTDLDAWEFTVLSLDGL